MKAVEKEVGRAQETAQSASTVKALQKQVQSGNAAALQQRTTDELTKKEAVARQVRLLHARGGKRERMTFE